MALAVWGMQKTVPSVAACGMPSVRLPAGDPACVMHCAVAWPNAPACDWLGQNIPVALVMLALPVVRGFRSTLSAPLKSPMASWGGQSWLVLAVAELPVVELVEQGPPTFGPGLQPVAPLPLQGGVPQLHCGERHDEEKRRRRGGLGRSLTRHCEATPGSRSPGG